MNSALKIFAFLALATLVASFPASTSQQNNANHDQLSSFARLSPQSQQIEPGTLPVAGMESLTRSKRAIIFRPLFVYRQQEIKKQRLKEERDQKAQAAAQPVPAGSNYAPNYYYKKNCNC